MKNSKQPKKPVNIDPARAKAPPSLIPRDGTLIQPFPGNGGKQNNTARYGEETDVDDI